MAGVMERTLGILEMLAARPEGLALAAIADDLNMPRSGAHRLLTDLVRAGYVRQLRDHGDYMLTTKLVSLGLSFLNASGILDVAQPFLDSLAQRSGEFVRLGVVDGVGLTWVAKAQGAPSGLRYDPDMGATARLSCSASGHAWLSTLSDEEALALVSRQGFGRPDEVGPNAPRTAAALLAAIGETRARGFSITLETFTVGMAAMAAPVRRPGEPALGVISIAGPTVRLTRERMEALGPALVAAAGELGQMGGISPLFRPRRPAPGDAHIVVAS